MHIEIHSDLLLAALAVGLSEVTAGGCLFVGDPLMDPVIGVVLTLPAGYAKWWPGAPPASS